MRRTGQAGDRGFIFQGRYYESLVPRFFKSPVYRLLFDQ